MNGDLKERVGLLVSDASHRRLLESATIHLGLEPVEIDPARLQKEDVNGLELILAELPEATFCAEQMRQQHREEDPYRPAVIAILPIETDPTRDEFAEGFDGILQLPQSPAAVAAQLSIALYTHRAFAQRYDDAMEELKLNRRIFHSVTSGISIADARTPDLLLTYVNPTFEVMTGYTLEEVQGKNCRFLQKGERDQPGLVLIREALRAGREVTAVLRNFRKDGAAFWNELRISPVYSRAGELTHFVGIQTDVTARVEFEIALRESEKLAAVGRLAASIAHEINNPLESVTNLVYLAEQNAPEHIRQFLSMADQELRRIRLITHQALRFNKQSSEPEAVNIPTLLDSVLDLHAGRIRSAEVTVERRDRLRQSVVCLEGEIRQVLNNLVSNATDAMRSTNGRLLIRSRAATNWRTGKKGVVVTVADTGVGIPREILGSIFRAFFTTKGNLGNGLGLWVSAEIVERHHGHIAVRSRAKEPSTGTVFRLFLPLQAATGSLALKSTRGANPQSANQPKR